MLMFGAIGLWAIAAAVGYLLIQESLLKAWGFFIVLVFLHAAELPISLKIGRENGLSAQTVVIKTMLYGFTWWVPVKKGIIER